MPKSKRQKIVSLTQVTKRVGKERKEELMQQVRDYVDQFDNIYLFSVDNMRNSKLKDLRAKFPTSRFWLGKNTIAAVAFGKNEESEIKPNLSKLAELMEGECGLFFTNTNREEVVEFFQDFKETDFARAGYVPIETIERHPGPIEMPHTLEPTLRNLGMTTSLKNGVIILEKEYTLCTAGQPLSAENAKLLKLFDIKLADFQIKLKSLWHDGEVEEL